MTDPANDILRALGVELPDVQPAPQEDDRAPVDPRPGWQSAAAKAYGLPDALAPRLTGRTEPEIFADASKLSRELAEPKSPRAEAVSLAQKAIANAERIRELGPGVVGGKLSPPPIETKPPSRPPNLIWQDPE